MFPGRIIAGKYRVLSVLGRGGMGVVCAAERLDTGEHVALKFLREDVESDMQPNERFSREARLAERLTSPHSCTLLGVDQWELGPFIVMELLDGRPLSSALLPNKPIAPKLAVRIAYEACLSLGEAHAQGIVHRDIKPGNIFLAWTAQQRVITKVLDFGVAKIPARVITESGGKSLTDAALLLGTPAYVAPEQLTNSKLVNAAADVWALGVLLYEMLSGRLPFFSPLVPRLLVMIARDEPQPLSAVAAEVPPALAAVVHRCLAKPLALRFRDALELAAALEPWLDRDSGLLEPLLREASLRPMRASSSPPPQFDSSDAELRLAPTSVTKVPDSLGPHTAARRVNGGAAKRALRNKILLGAAVGIATGIYVSARTATSSRLTTPGEFEQRVPRAHAAEPKPMLQGGVPRKLSPAMVAPPSGTVVTPAQDAAMSHVELTRKKVTPSARPMLPSSSATTPQKTPSDNAASRGNEGSRQQRSLDSDNPF